jgi:hypothetical protein
MAVGRRHHTIENHHTTCSLALEVKTLARVSATAIAKSE